MDDLNLGNHRPQDPSATQASLIAARVGDETAFQTLWEGLRPALEVNLLGRVRGRIEPALRQRLDAEAEDILQDVALTLHKRLRNFEYRGPGSLLAWAIQISNNVSMDWVGHWRSGKRSPMRERRIATAYGETDSAANPLDVRVQDSRTGPASAAGRRELSSRVADAMESLDDREHTIVLLRYFGGAEWSEIASATGAASADAVRMECHNRIIPRLALRLRSG